MTGANIHVNGGFTSPERGASASHGGGSTASACSTSARLDLHVTVQIEAVDDRLPERRIDAGRPPSPQRKRTLNGQALTVRSYAACNACDMQAWQSRLPSAMFQRRFVTSSLLARRMQGKSMQEYLRAELKRLADRPSVDAWLEQVRRRKRASQTRVSSRQILNARDADRR